MRPFTYVTPRSLDEAAATLARTGTAKAGGLDLIERMKDGIANPDRVVTLAAFERAGAAKIETNEKGVVIGAFATLAEVAAHRGLAKLYPALAEAAAEAATPQVRNQATVGGNLLQHPRCWYYRSPGITCLRKGGEHCPALLGENQYHAVLGYGRCPIVHPSSLAPALLALGATVSVHGKEDRPIERLWADPLSIAPYTFDALEKGEIVTALRLPPPGANAFVEIRHKQSFDWALAQAAVAKGPDGRWRVVLGAVAPIPWRSKPAEDVLHGGPLTQERLDKAAEAALENAKPLAKNAYKVKLAKVAVKRALQKAAGGPR